MKNVKIGPPTGEIKNVKRLNSCPPDDVMKNL